MSFRISASHKYGAGAFGTAPQQQQKPRTTLIATEDLFTSGALSTHRQGASTASKAPSQKHGLAIIPSIDGSMDFY